MRNAAVAFVVAGLAVPALAQDETLTAGKLSFDRGFGKGGVIRSIRAGGESLGDPRQVEVDAQNRVVVAGVELVSGSDRFQTDIYAIRVARYLPSGELDDSFGGDGLVTLPVAGSNLDGLVIDSFGGITVFGIFRPADRQKDEGAPSFMAARLGPDGSLDTGFSGDGLLGSEELGSVGVTGRCRASPADGSVVAIATAPGNDHGVLLVRLLFDGSLDPAFGQDGLMDLGDERGDFAVNAQGRVVLARHTTSLDDDFAPRVVQLLRNGTEDPGFGTFGVLRSVRNHVIAGDEVEIDRLGRILVVGREGNDIRAVYRFTADGLPDTTFGRGGRVPASFDVPGNTFFPWTPQFAVARDADRYAFFSFLFYYRLGSHERLDNGWFVQGMDGDDPMHAASLVRRVKRRRTEYRFYDMAVSPDGSAAYVAASAQTDRTHWAPILVKADLTRSARHPIPNLTVEWETEPKLTSTVSFTGAVRIRNTGHAPTANAIVAVFVSENEYLDPSDRLVTSFPTGRLRPGADKRLAVERDPGFIGRFANGDRLIAVVNPLGTLPETTFADDIANSSQMFQPLAKPPR